jgi:putative transposase
MTAKTTDDKSGRGRFAFAPTLGLGSGPDELERALLDAYRISAKDVLGELWKADVERLCGERWKPRPSSKAARAGWCACEIVLAGERVLLRRPRVRSVKGTEIDLPTFKVVSTRDVLDRGAVEDVTAAITTGTFPPGRHAREPIAADFVAGLAGRMSATQSKPRDNFEPGILISTVEFPDQSFLGAVGIDYDGQRRMVSLRSGSASNPASVAEFLDDLVAKHRRSAPPEIFFIGEQPVIRAAILEYFGASAILQRSPHEKRSAVLGLLPSSLQASVLENLLDAYAQSNARGAERALLEVVSSLERDYSAAAATLSDGLAETLTLHRLAGRGARTTARKGSRTPPPNV